MTKPVARYRQERTTNTKCSDMSQATKSLLEIAFPVTLDWNRLVVFSVGECKIHVEKIRGINVDIFKVPFNL